MSENPVDKAREQTSFDVDEMAVHIWSSPSLVSKLKRVQEIIANDPILKHNFQEYGLSREELFEIYCKKSYRVHKLFNYNDNDIILMMVSQFPE